MHNQSVSLRESPGPVEPKETGCSSSGQGRPGEGCAESPTAGTGARHSLGRAPARAILPPSLDGDEPGWWRMWNGTWWPIDADWAAFYAVQDNPREVVRWATWKELELELRIAAASPKQLAALLALGMAVREIAPNVAETPGVECVEATPADVDMGWPEEITAEELERRDALWQQKAREEFEKDYQNKEFE